MQFLVVFACALAAASAGHIVAPVYTAPQHLPVIGADGVPVDTPAVQHAKVAHYAHKAEAYARNGDYAYGYAAPAYAYGASAYAAPVVAHHSTPVVAAHHGVVAHTPIVAHHTPAAYPTTAGLPTSVNGVPLETPEVAAAKTHHFAAHAEAHARNGDYAYGYAAPAYAYGAATYAAPVVTGTYAHPAAPAHYHPAAYPTTAVHPASFNGVPLETPEVVAAKAKHFAAHAEALTRHSRAVYAPFAYAAHTYPYSAYAHHY